MRAHAPSLRAQGAAWESRATVPPALGCLRRRSRAAGAGSAIYYYVVSWDAAKTSWEDFRGKVLGPTDPKAAPRGSLRKTSAPHPRRGARTADEPRRAPRAAPLRFLTRAAAAACSLLAVEEAGAQG